MICNEKNKEKGNKAGNLEPAEKRKPISTVLKDVKSPKEFSNDFFVTMLNKFSCSILPPIVRCLKYMI